MSDPILGTDRVSQILTQAPDERSLNDIPFLLRSVSTYRAIAKDWHHDLACDDVCSCAVIDRGFNERMK